MIKAEIIADSLNPKGCRVTTFVLEYPRFIHAEVMTHRMFSKNAASSRAIPIEKMIQQVIDNPAMPVWWGKNQSGMQAKEELDNTNIKEYILNGLHDLSRNENSCCGDVYYGDHRFDEGYIYHITDRDAAKAIWLEARDQAIIYVRKLMEIGLHKQIANRILEPWFNIRIILTGTDFENFFALRAHKDAQPEFQELAYKMLELYNNSTPKQLKDGEWHIPFGDKMDMDRVCDLAYDKSNMTMQQFITFGQRFIDDIKIKIAVARCARVSYFNFEGKDDYQKDIEICDRLFGSIPRHLSPTEHVVQAADNDKYIGNIKGFKQYRYFFDDQNLKDGRVVKK